MSSNLKQSIKTKMFQLSSWYKSVTPLFCSCTHLSTLKMTNNAPSLSQSDRLKYTELSKYTFGNYQDLIFFFHFTTHFRPNLLVSILLLLYFQSVSLLNFLPKLRIAPLWRNFKVNTKEEIAFPFKGKLFSQEKRILNSWWLLSHKNDFRMLMLSCFWSFLI